MYNTDGVARRLKAIREDAGITQEVLALKLGVTSRHIQRFESASRAIPIEILVEISEQFNVSLDYLVLGKPSTQDSSLIKQKIGSAICLLQSLCNELP